MPYVHISHSPGQTLDDYRAVADAVGGHTPEGLLFSVQGGGDRWPSHRRRLEEQGARRSVRRRRAAPGVQSYGPWPGRRSHLRHLRHRLVPRGRRYANLTDTRPGGARQRGLGRRVVSKVKDDTNHSR